MATQTLTEEQVVQLVKQLPARSPAQPAAKEGIQPRISRITRIRNALLPIREIREIRGEKSSRKARLSEGDVVSVQPDGDGRLILVRLEKPKPMPAKILIVRRKGRHAVGVTERVVAAAEVQKFIDEFP